MSRIRRLLYGVASSYFLLGATVAYTLASIPLALHYLSLEEFGLWSMATQMIGYLSLLDLGLSNSVSRLLIDYKDRADPRAYATMLKTGALVTLIQGIVVLAVGMLLAPFL